LCGPVLNDDITDLEKIVHSADDVHNMPEYLVVCSWRSIKEVSLLLGQLTSTLPVSDPSGKVDDPSSSNSGLLTDDLVSQSNFCCTKHFVVR